MSRVDAFAFGFGAGLSCVLVWAWASRDVTRLESWAWRRAGGRA